MISPLRQVLGVHRLVLTCCLAFGGLLAAETLLAHGTMHTPASRVYKCRFMDNPADPLDPACAAAVDFAGSPQFLYD